jgi:aspartyl protease family protein
MIRILCTLALLAALPAAATDVNVIGLFPGKALVVIDRGAPRTLSAGDTVGTVKLLSADAKGAVLEIDGKRETLQMGQHAESASLTGARETATLAPDSQGHYLVSGQVNGAHVRFMVDTGATMVSMSGSEAMRLGIDYRKGRRGMSRTANGTVEVYVVTLDSVTVGGITLFNVDGIVHPTGGLDTTLLGMSFLGRTDMRREGDNLTLVKRY